MNEEPLFDVPDLPEPDEAVDVEYEPAPPRAAPAQAPTPPPQELTHAPPAIVSQPALFPSAAVQQMAQNSLAPGDAGTAAANMLTEVLKQRDNNSFWLAQARPRQPDRCRAEIMALCSNWHFSEKALYKFPRAGKVIEDISVVCARELARLWGYLAYGAIVVSDSPTERRMLVWAKDDQTSVRKEKEILVRKVTVGRNNTFRPIDPNDQTEIQRVVDIAVSKVQRNLIAELLPWDLIDDVRRKLKETRIKGVTQNPREAMNQIIDGFAEFNIPLAEVAAFAGVPEAKLRDMPPDLILYLLDFVRAMQEGTSTFPKALAQLARKYRVPEGSYQSAAELRAKIQEIKLTQNTVATPGKPQDRPTGPKEPDAATASPAASAGQPAAPAGRKKGGSA